MNAMYFERSFQMSWFTMVCVMIVLVMIARRSQRYVVQSRHCNTCGADNPRIAKFCRQCGGRLSNR
jgi:ribosomal protein L40E